MTWQKVVQPAISVSVKLVVGDQLTLGSCMSITPNVRRPRHVKSIKLDTAPLGGSMGTTLATSARTIDDIA